MKHGKISGETFKFSDPALFHGQVELGKGAAQCRSERQQAWLARGLHAPVLPSHSRHSALGDTHDLPASEAMVASDCAKQESKLARAADVLKQPIPRLTSKLKLSGRVPRMLPVRVVPESKHRVNEHLELEVEISPDVDQHEEEFVQSLGEPIIAEPYLESPRKLVPEIPPHVEVKVIPTPKKRGPRYAAAPEESPEAPVTKPLKIIRKRKEEAPKIFETVPRPVPQAMLEGIETAPDDPNGASE